MVFYALEVYNYLISSLNDNFPFWFFMHLKCTIFLISSLVFNIGCELVIWINVQDSSNEKKGVNDVENHKEMLQYTNCASSF